MPKQVGVNGVLVPSCDLIDPLPQQVSDGVLNVTGVPAVVYSSIKSPRQAKPLVQFPQQKQAWIRGHVTATEVQAKFRLKAEGQLCRTGCSHRPSRKGYPEFSQTLDITASGDGGYFSCSDFLHNPG